MLGLYVLKPGYALGDLNGDWNETKYFRCISNLCQCQTSDNRLGLISYDTNSHVILIRNFLEYNPLENPNQVKAACKKAWGIPPTPLTGEFLTTLEQFSKPLHKPLLELFKQLGERLPKPVTVSVTVTDNIEDYIPTSKRSGILPDCIHRFFKRKKHGDILTQCSVIMDRHGIEAKELPALYAIIRDNPQRAVNEWTQALVDFKPDNPMAYLNGCVRKLSEDG